MPDQPMLLVVQNKYQFEHFIAKTSIFSGYSEKWGPCRSGALNTVQIELSLSAGSFLSLKSPFLASKTTIPRGLTRRYSNSPSSFFDKKLHEKTCALRLTS